MQKYVLQLLVGTFIVSVGVTGFLWDPRAKSALISGAVFGGLNILWGAIMFQGGQKWVETASLIINAIFTVVLSWRATTAWSAYVRGAHEKLVPASLISLMLLASVYMIMALRNAANAKAAKATSRRAK